MSTERIRTRLRPLRFVIAVVLAMPGLPPAAFGGDAPDTVSGYVREMLPESAEAREARHREVAARRAGTMILVHRGAYDFAPENTLEAYAAAMDHGADGCEFDIRRSRDGVLYLHHDDDLGRVFKGDGPVSRLKGWVHEAGESDAAHKAFMAKPAPMVFVGSDPAPALKLIGRDAQTKPVPLPEGVRIQWTKDGPVRGPGQPPAPAKTAGGWRVLFDGKDMESWNPIGSAKWRIEDSVIAGGQDGDPKRSGLLATKEQFKDFEIELEFMIDEHGKYNSGVYLRNDPGAGGRTGYQVNIGRGAAEEYCAGLYTDKWLAKGDEKDSIRKKLDWNKLHIMAKGAHIEVTLNGIKVVDYTDLSPPEKSLQKGVIALQTYGAEGHAGWVKFRNIRIKEITPIRNGK